MQTRGHRHLTYARWLILALRASDRRKSSAIRSGLTDSCASDQNCRPRSKPADLLWPGVIGEERPDERYIPSITGADFQPRSAACLPALQSKFSGLFPARPSSACGYPPGGLGSASPFTTPKPKRSKPSRSSNREPEQGGSPRLALQIEEVSNDGKGVLHRHWGHCLAVCTNASNQTVLPSISYTRR